MKILLVAPGATWSTYDCYKYYLQAMHTNQEIDVQGFNFHNTMIYHRTAMNELFPHYSENDKNAVISIRSARELLLDTILFKPDVVLFVAGTLIPPEIYYELTKIRRELDRPFAIGIYFTESPYMDEMQESFVNFADVLFVNDKYSVKRFDPTGTRYVEYLPHSFNPEVHHPGNGNVIDDVYKSDVFFGATVFKERVEMLASMNWDNVDLRLVGNWHEWYDTEMGQRIRPYVTEHTERIMSNTEYAKFYRNAKIALNIHRTRGDINGEDQPLNNYTDAYSIGPRIYEAVACGAFVITDYRKEAEDIFGDTIEFFESNDDLEKKIHYWLDVNHEQERINKVEAARKRIQNCTFSDRLEKYILPTFKEVLQLRRIKNE